MPAGRTGRTPDPDKTVYDAYLFHKPLMSDADLPFSTYLASLFSPLVYASPPSSLVDSSPGRPVPACDAVHVMSGDVSQCWG